ncbi:energy-coupling factor transporter ATP-binding protein EcfA1 [Spirochaetia bacterium]|nr:energy-coupling factor transporter ATP-binding protein EcfA1 [Spirochaetia bacterium]
MIQIKDLDYNYFSGRQALNNINLDIQKGEFAAVVGHNGSGKSTLARLIAGIDKPKKGSVVVNGINTKDKKHFVDLRKTAGIVFQNPENQLVFEKARDDMAFGLKNIGLAQNEIDDRINEVSKMLNIENFTDSFELSMGQKQRLAIASVLVMQPECIVFDEPTAMLDPKGKKEIHNIIVDLHKKGFTIVYVTNVIDEVLSAQRIFILDKGSLKYEFKRSELFDNVDKLKSMSLEMPLLMDIIHKLHSCGINVDQDIRTAEDLVGSIIAKIKINIAGAA